jgi:hypothetical protein
MAADQTIATERVLFVPAAHREAAVGDFKIARYKSRHRGARFVLEFFDARFGVGDERGGVAGRVGSVPAVGAGVCAECVNGRVDQGVGGGVGVGESSAGAVGVEPVGDVVELLEAPAGSRFSAVVSSLREQIPSLR